MTWERGFVVINTLLTIFALTLTFVAVRFARDTLKLEKEARREAQLERRLNALVNVTEAVFHLHQKAYLGSQGRPPSA